MGTLSIASASEFVNLTIQVTLLVGALAVAYKFRVFDVLGYKFRSAVWCTSRVADDSGRTLFVGNYVIENTGSRRLKIARVIVEVRTPLEISTSESDRIDKVLDADDGVMLVTRSWPYRNATAGRTRHGPGPDAARDGGASPTSHPYRCPAATLARAPSDPAGRARTSNGTAVVPKPTCSGDYRPVRPVTLRWHGP